MSLLSTDLPNSEVLLCLPHNLSHWLLQWLSDCLILLLFLLLAAVKFHPSGRMLMAAGGDKKLRFFQIDGDKNEKIMSEYKHSYYRHSTIEFTLEANSAEDRETFVIQLSIYHPTPFSHNIMTVCSVPDRCALQRLVNIQGRFLGQRVRSGAKRPN